MRPVDRPPLPHHNVMIIGAGRAGQLLRRDILTSHPAITVLGFVDDSRQRPGVLGTINDMPSLTARYQVDEIIIAIPTAGGGLIRKILLLNKHTTIPIRLVPREQGIITHSRVSYAGVKAIQCDDFLGRPFIKVNIKKLTAAYRGKTVLVTGGAGSIGSEVTRQLLDVGARRVIIYDHSEYMMFNLDQQLRERGLDSARYELIIGSILNEARFNYAVARTQPDVVFHIAAYKHVYLMQDNIAEAVQNNIIGTKITADAAVRHRVPHFTFVSTDKVVNPQSIMGATKKIAEYYVRSLPRSATKFTIVRFGNVINSQGSVLPLFQRQIRRHHYVTITSKKMKRYFMSIREAAQLVLQSTARNSHGHIYILNMGELISIYEVAQCLIRSLGLRPGLDIALRIIGRRKGEKITEELYTSHERRHLVQTPIPYIWRLKRSDQPPENIHQLIAQLAALTQEYPRERAVLQRLRQCFPSLP